MSSRSFALDPKIDAYVESVSPSEPEILAKLREETAAMPNAQMQIGWAQGQLMTLLAGLIDAKRYLEIGVFTGYSSLLMARALPEGGQIVACDVSEQYTSVARRYWEEAGVASKVDLRIGPALETLDALLQDGQAESFDMAFIDADKENIPQYFGRCLQLVRKNGLILVDNVLRDGRVLDTSTDDPDTKTIQQFNADVVKDPHFESILLPIADGLTVARKR